MTYTGITKEEYLELRDQSEELPLGLIWEYWKEVKPIHYRELTLDEFAELFSVFARDYTRGPIRTPSGIKMVTYAGIVTKLYTYFNQKFEL